MLGQERGVLRLGFAGLGWIGRHRLAAVTRDGTAQVALLCDTDDSALEQARRLAPGARVVQELDALLDQELDGLVIATPSAAHAGQARLALQRGMAVFCQKPLACTAAEADSVLEEARQRDLLLATDLCYRCVAGLDEVREAIASGELGRIFGVEMVFHNAYGPDKPWFYDLACAGGGCFMDLGIHLVDLLLWLLPGSSVSGVESRLFREGRRLTLPASEVEDYAEVLIDLDGAATVARLSTSWGLSAGRDAVIELALYGTRGGARMRNVDGSFYDFEVERTEGTQRRLVAGPPDAWGGRAITTWTRALASGRGFDMAALGYHSVARVIDQVYGR